MNYEEFKELPIGTVFIYKDLEIVEVKITKFKTLSVCDVGRDYGSDNAGFVDCYSNRSTDPCYVHNLELAPKWIAKLYEVEE